MRGRREELPVVVGFAVVVDFASSPFPALSLSVNVDQQGRSEILGFEFFFFGCCKLWDPVMTWRVPRRLLETVGASFVVRVAFCNK